MRLNLFALQYHNGIEICIGIRMQSIPIRYSSVPLFSFRRIAAAFDVFNSFVIHRHHAHARAGFNRHVADGHAPFNRHVAEHLAAEFNGMAGAASCADFTDNRQHHVFRGHALTQLAARRIPVLAVSGNHDSAERLDFASSLLAEQNVHIAGRFTGCPKQVVLNDRHGPIEFTLLPFVRAATVRHYLPDADITDYDSAVGAALAVCEPAAPRRVLVAHQMVVSGVCPPQLSGSETAPLTVGTVDSIDAARFAGFCYAALGHIHRAQRVGIDAVRYAGSPLCYHLDECGMQKSVTLVRVGKRGVEKIEQLPLTPRRAMRHLTGPLARLTARPTDTEDYIWATLTDPTPLPDAMAQLRAAYPNAMRLDYLPQGEVAHPLDMTQAVRGKPFVELFQDFFTKMNGRPLTVEETVAVKRLREEASKSE